MQTLLAKVFVRSFYRANAGFFLFFFFVFFGAVEGGALLRYHLSLMESLLQSSTTLCVVIVLWLLYHLKCIGFFLKIFNSADGAFLYNLQTSSASGQLLLYATLYLSVYAPVFVYGLAVAAVGLAKGYTISALLVLLFQLLSVVLFSGLIYRRANNWLTKKWRLSFPTLFPKNFSTLLLMYFGEKQQKLLLGLKAFSLLLLYVVLVWNRGRYDNDSFLLFYFVLFLAHAVLPYFSVAFFEQQFPSCRNLPLSLLRRGMAFLLPYTVIILPEAFYLFVQANQLPSVHRLGYTVNLVAALLLLTAIQYSGAHSRSEYLKAVFALGFASLFAWHAKVFWFWIGVQTFVAVILFASGYFGYEKPEE